MQRRIGFTELDTVLQIKSDEAYFSLDIFGFVITNTGYNSKFTYFI